jgi:hypothetical protein
MLVIWSALLMTALVLETLGRRAVGTLPPLECVLRRLRSAPLGRAGIALAWMWLGWHLFAR